MTDAAERAVSADDTPSGGALFATFGRIGCLSFGGPTAQIALMHRVLVDEKRWLSEGRFAGALSFCMLLPGPEAMQLATYAGWRLRGVWGGLLAGTLFVAPGALVILVLAAIYGAYGNVPMVQALFLGVQAAVLAIVFQALVRIAGRALKGPGYYALAVLAFVAIYAFSVPFPIIIAAAGLVGAVIGAASPADAEPHAPVRHSLAGTAATAALWLGIWLVPLAALSLALGDHVLAELGWFFSKLAVVTFGGAYAVLAYMTQEVVEARQWLTTAQMMDGLGLAETTPGPLILVTQFVGALAAATASTGAKAAMGLAGAAVTLWATFVPCFLWIFVGAPYVEWITAQPRLRGALAGITAAVVGVIANLSVWFGFHVLFGTVREVEAGLLSLALPTLGTVDVRAVALAALAAALIFGTRLSILWTLAIAAAAGLALSAI